MRYVVVCAFLGYHYHGWQIQKDVITIQGIFQDILSIIFKTPIKVIGCSRTDHKVSAEHFVFHFDGETTIPLENLKLIINNHLPSDIVVHELHEADVGFHARKDAKAKTYRYTLEMGPYNVFEKEYVYQLNQSLDIDLMKAGLTTFVGTHDFTSFNATPLSVIENQVRTIMHVDIKQVDTKVVIHIKGDGFLHHMVRMIVGSLIEVGQGRLSLNELQAILDVKTKGACRYNAPAEGLVLERVYYEL